VVLLILKLPPPSPLDDTTDEEAPLLLLQVPSFEQVELIREATVEWTKARGANAVIVEAIVAVARKQEEEKVDTFILLGEDNP